jgi:hypothetical protein
VPNLIDTVQSPAGRERALRVRLAGAALCTLVWSCAASQPPAPAQTSLATTTGGGSEPALFNLRPVDVDQVEDRLEEAPVNHGIALGSLDTASLPAHVDAARVERTIAKHLGTIRDCMERKLRRNTATRGGKIKVALIILPAGGVREARTLYNGTGSPIAANCVLASVRKLTFDPSPTGETSRVEYSFVFGGNAPSLAAVP